MLFIRQLGLKAYIDFSGAIHTRYSHAIGAMYLAGKISDLVAGKQTKTDVEELLQSSKDTLMAAGFLHDIGHGPFSHAVDFAMQTIANKKHEELAAEIIESQLAILEKSYIPVSSVVDIIKGNTYPFISHIIDGPLDVDKLDYLMRDAYHIGLEYSLDVDHFASSYMVLGAETKEPSKCILGLENSPEAIVTAELFVLIWRNMYELVYYATQSRITEKMLEKAILSSRNNTGSKLLDCFSNLDSFIGTDDDSLLKILDESGEFPKDIVTRIREDQLYNFSSELAVQLNDKIVKMGSKMVPDLSRDDGAFLGEAMTVKLCAELGVPQYHVICDILKSRVPKRIDIDEYENDGEPVELYAKSDVLPALKEKPILKVYINPNVHIPNETIRKQTMKLIEGWQ